MEHGCSVLRTVSPMASSRLKVGSALPAILSRQYHNGVSDRRRMQHHYAESQNTAGYHLSRRGSEFRAMKIPMKDLHSRQKRGEGPKHRGQTIPELRAYEHPVISS